MRSALLSFGFAAAFFSAVTTVLTSVPTASMARGEAPVRLPEVRVPDIVAPDAVRVPVWSQPASASPVRQDVLAHGDGIVAFSTGGRLCGYAESDGRRRWCAGPGRTPAFAGGIFAYVANDGMVRAVRAATGVPVWQFAFPTSREAEVMASKERAAVGRPLEQVVWAAGNGFLAARTDMRAGRGAPSFGEISLAGRLLWSADTHVNADAPIAVPPYALNRRVDSGAQMVGTEEIFRLGPGGGLKAGITGAWDVVEIRAPSLVLMGDDVQEMQDHFLTRDVWLADIRDGKIGEQFHYEPDYDANLERYERNALAIDNDAKGIGSEGDAVYVGVGPNVYRYRLADATGQRPLLVSAEGRYAGGPVHGAIFVERRDGVWSLRPRANAIEARLIMPSSQPMTALAVAGRVAYVATADGHVRGMNIDDNRIVFDARPCHARRIGTGPHRVYVVCTEGTDLRVVAFPRPDAP